VIDCELITRKMVLIGSDLEEITRLADMPLQEYLSDIRAEVLAERYLERVIGRMIDINFHMITESGQAPPRDYYDSFVIMGTLGILPPDLARRIASCAGLRNRIVHEYDEIDPTRVHAALRDAARDVVAFLRQIESRLPPAE
jgi:uncharacterized protein YutE (UPF0331/DUF86 family)